MQTAKSKEQYTEAWKHHIQQLTTLALAGQIEYNRYRATIEELEKWLELATKQSYEESDNG